MWVTWSKKVPDTGFSPIRRRYLLMLALLSMATALTLAACGGGGEKSAPQPVVTPTATPTPTIEPIIVASDLAVGPNRFVVGLVDPTRNELVIDARLHLRLFKLESQAGTATLKAVVDARPLTVQRSYTHIHEDGKLENHEAGTVGVYVAQLEFDSPGTWGVEITGTQKDGQPLPRLVPAFTVQERSRSVPLGAPAPSTVQLVLSDVKDISEIDTSNPPNPDMHSMTVADAVKSGTPTVIVFATPSFCVSRTCGPVKETVDQLYGKYKGRANFVHIEPYDLAKVQSGQGLVPVPAMAEWGLQSEPWVFMVDEGGTVAVKFEGIVGFDELEAALTSLLATPRS